jgi:hypothetical protein
MRKKSLAVQIGIRSDFLGPQNPNAYPSDLNSIFLIHLREDASILSIPVLWPEKFPNTSAVFCPARPERFAVQGHFPGAHPGHLRRQPARTRCPAVFGHAATRELIRIFRATTGPRFATRARIWETVSGLLSWERPGGQPREHRFPGRKTSRIAAGSRLATRAAVRSGDTRSRDHNP